MVEVAEASLAAHVKILGKEDAHTAASMVQVGLALKNLKSLDEAAAITRDALAIQRQKNEC